MTKLVAALTAALLGTLPSTTPRIDHNTPNGAIVDFSFGFRTPSTSVIKVFVDADGVAGTASSFVLQEGGYAVALTPKGPSDTMYPGGTVTFTVPPVNGASVRIERTVPVTQDSLWTPYSAFKAKTLEGQLDYRGMVDQQLDRTTGDLAAKDAALGAKDAALQVEIDAEEAARFTGDSAERAYVTQVLAGISSAEGLAARVTTLEGHTAGWFNIASLGAVADNATDVGPTINAAFALADDVLVPCGTYRIKTQVSIPSGKRFRGSGRCTVFTVPDDAISFIGDRVITNSSRAAGNTNITISDFAVSIPSNFRLVAGATYPGVLRFERVDGLTISRVYSAAVNTVYTVMHLSGGNRNVRIDGVAIYNARTLESSGAFGLYGGQDVDPTYDSYNVSITNSTFESGYDESFVIYGWQNKVYDVAVTGCVIINKGTTQLAVGILGYNVAGQAGSVKDITFTGNAIQGQTNILTGADTVTFNHNAIRGPTGARDGVFVERYGVGGAYPTGVRIHGGSITSAGRYGVFNTAPDTIIEDVEILSAATAGLYTVGGKAIGNRIRNSSTGIFIEGSDARVTGNTIVGATTGIATLAAERVRIEGNEVVDSSDTAISLNSSTVPVAGAAVKRNTVRGPNVTAVNGIRAFNGSGGSWATSVLEGNQSSGATNPYAITAGWKKGGNYQTTSQTPWPVITGNTATRPSLEASDAGFVYRDITLDADGKPIWWTGTKWIDATGADAP
jgi:hypothetical protein